MYVYINKIVPISNFIYVFYIFIYRLHMCFIYVLLHMTIYFIYGHLIYVHVKVNIQLKSI